MTVENFLKTTIKKQISLFDSLDGQFKEASNWKEITIFLKIYIKIPQFYQMTKEAKQIYQLIIC